MARIYNFSSGPATLPLTVLEQAQSEMLDYQSTGMSIMEMSHRGKAFDAVIKGAESNIRKLMNISDDYAVLFLPGGASQQFATIPQNFLTNGKSADYINTGSWATKAISEAKIVGKVNTIWDGKDCNYMRTPKLNELSYTPSTAYTFICTNETIGGICWHDLPITSSPLVADMSSDIMSRVIDVNNFGLIFAGAQKNIGPSGVALVIIRKDLVDLCPDTVNIFFRFKTQIKEPSLYNTPNTWAIYIIKLVTEWVESQGGIPALEAINRKKAKLLYETLDGSSFWKPCAHKDSRSIMNITWRLGSEELEAKFVQESKAAGFDGLKGHRSVGGIRASIYNAFPLKGVEDLVSFMKDFERKHG